MSDSESEFLSLGIPKTPPFKPGDEVCSVFDSQVTGIVKECIKSYPKSLSLLGDLGYTWTIVFTDGSSANYNGWKLTK